MKQPQFISIGDIIVAPHNPRWGQGIVLDAQLVGEMQLQDGPTYQLSPKSVGQRLSIKFSDGRTRTLLSSSTKIQKASDAVASNLNESLKAKSHG
jgi:hypothetical protein